MDMKKLGKYIAKLRSEKDMTQDQLAEYVGVTRQAVSRWETGKSIPDVEIIPVLAKELGTTIEDLIYHVIDDNELTNMEELKKKRVRTKSSKKEENEEIPINYRQTDIYNVILNLYDDADKSKNKNNKYHKMLITIILITAIIITCMVLYIISSLYNAVSLYNINGDNGNISINNGIFVITRDKIYFDLGTINNNTDKDINDIELYYYDKNDNRSLVFKNEGYVKGENIILHDFIGYNEYFNYDELDYILKSLTLELTLEDDTIETISLETEKEKYSKIFLKRENPAGIEDKSKVEEKEETEETKELEKLVKDNFEPNRDGYVYSIKYNSNVIDYIYLEKCLSIYIMKKNKIIESLFYDPGDNSIVYQKHKGEAIIQDERLDLKNINQEKQEIINKFYKYYNLLKSEFEQ